MSVIRSSRLIPHLENGGTQSARHNSNIVLDSFSNEPRSQVQTPKMRRSPLGLRGKQPAQNIFDADGNVTPAAYQLCMEVGIKEEDLYEKKIEDFKLSTSQNSPKEEEIAAMRHRHYEKRRQQRIQQISSFMKEKEEKERQSTNMQLYSAEKSQMYSVHYSPNSSFMSCKTRASKDQRVREIMQEMDYNDKIKLVSRLLRVERAQQLKKEVDDKTQEMFESAIESFEEREEKRTLQVERIQTQRRAESEKRKKEKQEKLKELEQGQAEKLLTDFRMRRKKQIRMQSEMLDWQTKEEAKEQAAFNKQNEIQKKRSEMRETRFAQKHQENETWALEAKTWLQEIEERHRQRNEAKQLAIEKTIRSRSLNNSHMIDIIKFNQSKNDQARQEYEQTCLKGFIYAKQAKPLVKDMQGLVQKRKEFEVNAREKRQESEKQNVLHRRQVFKHLNSKLQHADSTRKQNQEAAYQLISSKNEMSREAVLENLRFSEFHEKSQREREEQRTMYRSQIADKKKQLKEDIKFITTAGGKDLDQSMLLHDVLLSESAHPTYRVNTASAAIQTTSGGSPNYRTASVFGKATPSVNSAHK